MRQKGQLDGNFRPIVCLPTTFKILTDIIADNVYEHLDQKCLLTVQQNGCRKHTRGTKDQRMIDGQGPMWHRATVPCTARPSRRSAQSTGTLPTSSSRLVVPRFRLSTVGSRAFNVSAPRIWNGVSDDVVSAPTLSSFRRRLKPFLFQQSYPDIVI